MTRIQHIGHIHNTIFSKSQFSTSHPQKWPFSKMVHLTFWWKYRVCGFKIEISGYPLNSLIITYPPYKYEVDRIKTHEMRAKYFSPFFFFPSTVVDKMLWPKSPLFTDSFGKSPLMDIICRHLLPYSMASGHLLSTFIPYNLSFRMASGHFCFFEPLIL